MLLPGTTISRYHIVERLGDGGMGMYGATDTRPGSQVAINVLPEACAKEILRQLMPLR